MYKISSETRGPQCTVDSGLLPMYKISSEPGAPQCTVDSGLLPMYTPFPFWGLRCCPCAPLFFLGLARPNVQYYSGLLPMYTPFLSGAGRPQCAVLFWAAAHAHPFDAGAGAPCAVLFWAVAHVTSFPYWGWCSPMYCVTLGCCACTSFSFWGWCSPMYCRL